jgi:hypothetical protein
LHINSTETYISGLATHYISIGQIPKFMERLTSYEDIPNEDFMEDLIDEFQEEPIQEVSDYSFLCVRERSISTR